MKLFKPLKRLLQSPLYAFFTGFFAALLGVLTAYMLFPENIGIVSVFFASLALFPFWNSMLKRGMAFIGTERIVMKNEIFRLTELRLKHSRERISIINVIKNHWNVFEAYIFSFMGMFFVYLLLEMLVSPVVAASLFAEQTAIFNVHATASVGTLMSILSNNIVVLLICFFIALVYRSGVFIVAWNASVWGVVLGHSLRQSVSLLAVEPATVAVLSVLVILPHLIGEALAYIFAAVSGSLLFEAFIKRMKARLLRLYLNDVFVILILAAVILLVSAIIEVFFAFPVIAGLR